jgi:hypothetical protein
MKKQKAHIKRREYWLPFPESMDEVEALVPDEEDRLELFRFAFHHRLRSAVVAWKGARSDEEVQSLIDDYRYRCRNANARREVV